MNKEVEDFIAHVGVRGMRWGVRKKREPRKISKDYKSTARLRNRKTSELSNYQLKRANERINLEQNYSRLNPTKVQRGNDKVKEVLAIGATVTAAYALYQSPLGQKLVKNGASFMSKRVAK